MKKILTLALLVFVLTELQAKTKLRVDHNTDSVAHFSLEEVESIAFGDNNDFSIYFRQGDSLHFPGTASGIQFVQEPDSNTITIIRAEGWLEAASVSWELTETAASYRVYCKSQETGSDYWPLDTPLIRNYGSYGRADAIGLKAGYYRFKIIPLDRTGLEMADLAAESDLVKVSAHDRGGFAHYGMNEGVGAYKNDGSLKDKAVVFYVTKDNCNSLTHNVIVDSKGNTELRTGIGKILQGKQKGYDSTPWAVRFTGTIRTEDFDSEQLISDQDGLLLKSDAGAAPLNVTLEGVGNDATAYGWGLTLYRGSSIEVRNLGLMNFQEDGISIKSSQHAWVHHCDIFYGSPGSDSDQNKGDGSLDLKDDCQYATFSYNHFWDAGKVSLCGMTGESGENWISYHHNWFDHSDSRHPRVRVMSVHIYNNYYDGVAKYGVGATMGSSVFVEANYFRNTKRPMMISLQGTDATGDGTFSGENGGMIKSFGNVFAETPTLQYIPHTQSAGSFDAYEATSRQDSVPASFKSLVGNHTYNNFDLNEALMYTYSPHPAEDVPEIVCGPLGAGRMNQGDFSWSFNNATDDASYAVDEALKAAIAAYSSSLLGFFGQESNEDPGEDPGEGPGEDPGEGVIICTFSRSTGASNDFFTVTGNYSDSKGTVSYNDSIYTECLKMESSTSITFVLSDSRQLTLVFGPNEAASMKLNGTSYTDEDNDKIILVDRLEAGSYEITKSGTCNLFYISLSPFE